MKPKLHTHRECGSSFHSLLHTSYIRDYWAGTLNEAISLKVLCPVTTLDCVLLKDNTVTKVKQTDVSMYWICLAQDNGLYRDRMDIAVTYSSLEANGAPHFYDQNPILW